MIRRWHEMMDPQAANRLEIIMIMFTRMGKTRYEDGSFKTIT